MIALLSIKPEFAHQIFAGKKRFEFRKSIFRKPVTRVVVYATAPVSMVIGEFEVDGLLCESPEDLWRQTHEHAGISKEYFDAYFADRDRGYAIRVKGAREYSEPRPLREVYASHPPQSFVYLREALATG